MNTEILKKIIAEWLGEGEIGLSLFSIGWDRELFIDVFSVADLYHQDHMSVIMNFINDTVISRSYFVKLVISLHFCYSRVRKIFREGVDFPLYSYPQILFDSGSELYCVCHFRDPIFSRTPRRGCHHPALSLP